MSVMPTDEDKAYERGLIDGAESVRKAYKRRVRRLIDRILHVADAMEAGGHKSRAKMWRAHAKEFEQDFL